MAHIPDSYNNGWDSDSSISPQPEGDPLFHICWRRQSCQQCLAGGAPCSWCSSSSTCIPNHSRLPIFAPITTPNICPLGSRERWELRARPFGCNVSTLTLLTAIVAVVGTLVAVGLAFGVSWLFRKLRGRWRQRQRKYTCGVLGWMRWGRSRSRRRRGSRLGYPYREDTSDAGDVDEESEGREDGETRPLLG